MVVRLVSTPMPSSPAVTSDSYLPFNLTGYPALVIPAVLHPGGAPAAIIADRWTQGGSTVYRIARTYEDATG
jgi:Asp-tRNA(Asn)/Glu-tRNA(Gln) amidotransferase A subunit family amidase